MGRPLQYHPRPPRTEPTAHEALETLLQSCHEHGVLRFANDLVCSNTEVAKVLVQGLENQGTLNAIQNLSILAMALSRIPPAQFYRIVFALKDGLATLTELPPQGKSDTPGLSGAYHMLHDEQLWRALTPLGDALKAIARGLQQPAENPISAFSGKPGSPG